jgi:hypothetical protein
VTEQEGAQIRYQEYRVGFQDRFGDRRPNYRVFFWEQGVGAEIRLGVRELYQEEQRVGQAIGEGNGSA